MRKKRNRKAAKEYHRRWYLKNREKKLAQNSEWRKKNKKKMAILVKDWASKNKERVRKSHAKSELRRKQERLALRPIVMERLRLKKLAIREKNKEAVRLRKNLRIREWRKLNRAICVEHSRAKEAIRRKATIGDRKQLRRFYKVVKSSVGIKCFYCKKEVDEKDRHIDHKIPLSRGGAHAVKNLCCACSACNMKKHTRTHREFFKLIKGLLNDS
jgi:5-methylcytosine-specific restriction endonuclease McrA